MRDKIEITGNEYDETILPIFADPNFLLTNLLGAINVQVKGNEFTAELPLSTLLGRATMVAYGKIFTSVNIVTYVVNIAGYGGNRGGKIKVIINSGKISIEIELDIPLSFLNSRVIKERINEFRNRADELIRLERIKRKI